MADCSSPKSSASSEASDYQSPNTSIASEPPAGDDQDDFGDFEDFEPEPVYPELRFNDLTPQRQAARQRLADVLDSIESPGTRAIIETRESYPQPGLYIDDYPYRLPIFQQDAEDLVDRCSHEVYPPNGDDSYAFETKDISVRQTWTRFVASIVAEHAQSMGFPPYRIKASRVIVYRAGPTIRLLDRSRETSASFGTCAITLPGDHEGGKTVLRPGLRTTPLGQIVDTALTTPKHDSENDIVIETWYHGVPHTLRAVTSGYKVVLEYDLVAINTADVKTPGLDLEEAVRACTADPSFQQEIYLLDQAVQKFNKADTELQGRSAWVYQQLSACALKHGCFVLHGCVEEVSDDTIPDDEIDDDQTPQFDLFIRATPTDELTFKKLERIEIEGSDLLPRSRPIPGTGSHPEPLRRRVVMLIRQETAWPFMDYEHEIICDVANEPTIDLLAQACALRSGDGSGFQDRAFEFVHTLHLDSEALDKAVRWSFKIQSPRLFAGLLMNFNSSMSDFHPKLRRALANTIDAATRSLDGAEAIWNSWLNCWGSGVNTNPTHLYRRLQQMKRQLRPELQPAFDRWSVTQVVEFLMQWKVLLNEHDVSVLVRVALSRQDEPGWLTTKFAGWLRFNCTRKGMISFVEAFTRPESVRRIDPELGTEEACQRLFCLLFPRLRSMGPYFCVTPDDLSDSVLAEDPQNITSHHIGNIIATAVKHRLADDAVRVLDACTYYFRHMDTSDIAEETVRGFLVDLCHDERALDTFPKTKDSFKWLLIAAMDFIVRHRRRQSSPPVQQDWTWEHQVLPLSTKRVLHFLGVHDYATYFHLPGPPLFSDTDTGLEPTFLLKDFADTKVFCQKDWKDLLHGECDQRRIIRLTSEDFQRGWLECWLAKGVKYNMERELRTRWRSSKRKVEDSDDGPSGPDKRTKTESGR